MKRVLLTVSILFLFLTGCKQDASSQYIYQIPEQLNDGFMIATTEDVGIDAELIESAVTRTREGKFKEIHSLLIYKDGKLILDEYFTGHRYQWDAPQHHAELVDFDNKDMHEVMSVTKSFTGTLTGIAIEKGYIDNIHQSIFDYLPDHQHLKTDGKEKITIEHLVSMTSGLEWNEWNAPLSSTSNDVIALWVPPCEEQLTCILERPLLTAPGTRFNYSGGGMILLGEVIRHASGMDIHEFSRKYLFEPMGVDSSHWAVRFENGVYETSGLKLTPRDMLKFGVLYLNNGNWGGRQLVTKEWVDKSSQIYANNKGINIPHVDSGKNGYGYSWWIKTYTIEGKKIDMYKAGGWGGQEIIVIPELDAVVVFTGGTYTSKIKVFKVFRKYILPALIQ